MGGTTSCFDLVGVPLLPQRTSEAMTHSGNNATMGGRQGLEGCAHGIACLSTRRDFLAATGLAALGTGLSVAAKAGEEFMRHVVLLGDSIFANAAYVAGGPDVITQLRGYLPAGSRATLLAVDGAVTGSIRSQLGRLPADASHLVVSIGGNDALGQAGILEEQARSVAEVLDRLAGIRERFALAYQTMLEGVLDRRLPTALCTIYDGRLPQPRGRLATTALTLFNDTITREAFERDLPLIDLRLICDEDADYANSIEPSVQGGRKIAGAVAGLVDEHDFTWRPAVFVQ